MSSGSDDARAAPREQPGGHPTRGALMWWFFGSLAAVLYIVLIVTLGITTLRNGHVVMFILGIFIPLFWIIGAVIRRGPRRRPDAGARRWPPSRRAGRGSSRGRRLE